MREWLDSLRWDGVKRAPTWLIDIMGVEDTPLVRAVSCAWLVSAAARIYRPGCKVDTVLVLEGKPGIHKSSVLRAIAGDDWFLEMSIADVAAKDAMQLLRRKWLVEFPENRRALALGTGPRESLLLPPGGHVPPELRKGCARLPPASSVRRHHEQGPVPSRRNRGGWPANVAVLVHPRGSRSRYLHAGSAVGGSEGTPRKRGGVAHQRP